jgi:small subunit ribosomal protein S8
MHYNLLVRIRNAEGAQKEKLTVPFSGFDFAVAKVLAEEGYIKDAEKKNVGRRNFIEIKLARGRKGPAISGFKILSKPSRHIYLDYRNLKPVRQGYGVGVISTPKGIMSNKTAKKNKVGGEYLFEIW